MRRRVLVCFIFVVAILVTALGCNTPSKQVAQSPDMRMNFGQGFRDLTAELMRDPMNAWLSAFPRIRKPGEPCGPPVCEQMPRDTACIFGPVGSGLVLMDTAEGSMGFYVDPVTKTMIRQSTRAFAGSLMAWQDIDGDGIADRVFGAPGLTIEWGGNALATRLDPSLNVGAVHIADINSDGYRDILVSGQCREGARGSIEIYFQGPARVFSKREIMVGNWCHSGYAVWAGKIGSERFIITAAGGGPEEHAPSMYRMVGERDGFPRYEPYGKEPGSIYYGPLPSVDEAHAAIEDGCFTGHAPREWCYGNRTKEESYRLILEDIARPNSWAYRAAMGMAVGDFTGDGHDEMIVTLNSDHFTASFSVGGVITDITAKTGFPVDPLFGDHHLQIPWAVALLPLRRTNEKDVVFTYGKDGDAWMSGGDDHQPTRLFAQIGKESFVNASKEAGLNFTGQWKSLAVGDLFGRGVPDLCVGGQGEIPRLLVNQIDNGNYGISLRLIERSGNISTDARVEVEVEGLPKQYVRPDGIGSPWVFSEPIVFAGLGTESKANSVRVIWPSGQVSEHRVLAAGSAYTIKEP